MSSVFRQELFWCRSVLQQIQSLIWSWNAQLRMVTHRRVRAQQRILRQGLVWSRQLRLSGQLADLKMIQEVELQQQRSVWHLSVHGLLAVM